MNDKTTNNLTLFLIIVAAFIFIIGIIKIEQVKGSLSFLSQINQTPEYSNDLLVKNSYSSQNFNGTLHQNTLFINNYPYKINIIDDTNGKVNNSINIKYLNIEQGQVFVDNLRMLLNSSQTNEICVNGEFIHIDQPDTDSMYIVTESNSNTFLLFPCDKSIEGLSNSLFF